MKFGVIIVTYNRLELLKECIRCVRSQTVPFSHICVVDNHSTDGTDRWLDEILPDCPQLSVHRMKENLGGAGGFSYGLSRLSETDCDWCLIIDDDAMIAPDYIEEIEKAILRTDYLAFSGTVKTAGKIDTSHRRILKNPYLMLYDPVPETAYEKPSFEYHISTFCGLLLSAGLIREIGLPRTDYFIWFDDTEYCLRFQKQTKILNVNTALLDHRTTPASQGPIVTWKNYYGFRNSIDIGKTYSLCPPLYMAYIVTNHLTHIVLDSLSLLIRKNQPEKRLRIQIYRDVLKGLRQKPSGRDPRYLPSPPPKQT